MWQRFPLIPLIGALLLIYTGERVIITGWWHLGLRWISMAVLAVALLGATLRWITNRTERRRAFGWVLGQYVVCSMGVGLYALYADWLPWTPPDHIRTALRIVWPAIILLALAPVIAMEVALAGMLQTPALELWRVRLAARSARIIALTLITFAALNITAVMWNKKIDLSYFKTSKAGTAVLTTVQQMTQPIHFILFFPPGNAVLEHTRAYLDELVRVNPLATLEVLDQATHPDRAKALQIRSNGYLVVEGPDRHASIRLGLDVEASRRILRELDASVHAKLLYVMRPPRVAYFTTGHLERDTSKNADDKVSGISDFKTSLRSLGFTIKNLGLAEGLGNQIPKDAAVVAVMGPQTPLLPAERLALLKYIDGGGHLLLALEPESGALEPQLQERLGISIQPALVANDTYLVRVQGQSENRYDLLTTRATPHAITKTLTDYAGQLGVILLHAGAIQASPSPRPDRKLTTLLPAMPGSWLDIRHNGVFDGSQEPQKDLNFAAAITSTSTPVMRVVVVADVDLFADGPFAYAGNNHFATDAFRWLSGDEDQIGTVESEKDIPIVHRKDRDALWFYGTSFAAPALVFMLGLLVTRRQPRRQREEKPHA